MDYLVGKLQTMKRNGIRMEFELVNGKMHEYALLVTNQKSLEGNIGFVADFNKDGKVNMLNITVQSFF